jgi:uncharacterized protein YndB with AHSA1/START domain
MTERSVIHATFTVDRTYDASPARVFKAFADPEAKRRWFVEGEGWEIESYEPEFRVGGLEKSRFRFQGGELIGNDTIYQDIVPDERIVTTYSMTIGGRVMSVSLATIEFKSAGKGARLVYTEQGAYLDGLTGPGEREIGCAELLETLDKELKRDSAAAA